MELTNEHKNPVVSFLKWSAPTKATKEVHDIATQMKKLVQSPKSLDNKCGDLREVLNCIQSPKEWSQDGLVWKQELSNEPATRQEVIQLTEALDETIAHSQARETGICEIREAIYADLFDELIRQISINCIERGLLLLRVRNETRDSIKAFQQLYVSSLAYGARKTLESDEVIEVLKKKAEKLYDEKKVLERELENIMFTIAEKEKELAERMEQITSKHRAQIEFQEEMQTNLKYQLMSITSWNKNKT